VASSDTGWLIRNS